MGAQVLRVEGLQRLFLDAVIRYSRVVVVVAAAQEEVVLKGCLATWRNAGCPGKRVESGFEFRMGRRETADAEAEAGRMCIDGCRSNDEDPSAAACVSRLMGKAD